MHAKEEHKHHLVDRLSLASDARGHRTTEVHYKDKKNMKIWNLKEDLDLSICTKYVRKIKYRNIH